MNSLTNRTMLWWLLLLATVPSFISLLRGGFFPMHDDLPVFRQFAMEECLIDRQIPCRWTKELGFGYGYPLMNFYPPLPYIFGFIPRAMGLSFIDTTKILFILGLVVSAGFMARLGSLFFDKWGSLAAAVLYLYGPYHALNLYVRGDLNELWAMAFFPGVLWASYKLINFHSVKNVVLVALTFSGIALSHLGMSLVMTPVLIMWCLVWVFVFQRQEWKASFKYLFGTGLLSLALSAFFIIPVMFEQKFVHVETLTMGYFNYLAHFVDLNQLFFSRFWGYGASVYGPEDGMSFQIGTAHSLLGLIGLLGIFGLRKKISKSLLVAYVFFLMLFFGSAFMMHWKATPIWMQIPKIEFLQFPWRLLALVLTAISFLAASIIGLVPVRHRPISFFLLLLLLLVFYGSYFRPELWWADRTDSLQFSGKTWQRALTAGIFDYLPKWSKMPPGKAAPGDASAETTVSVRTLQKTSNLQRYLVDNRSTSPSKLQINTLFYPGWTTYVNEKPVEPSIEGPEGLGLINVSVPPGRSTVSLRFGETSLRFFSDAISFFTWAIVIFWIVKPKIATRPSSSHHV